MDMNFFKQINHRLQMHMNLTCKLQTAHRQELKLGNQYKSLESI
uniref:Uncharacterized protein n=1 Tax=Arundo donax TaxID=35708 RepID=A0A0A9AM46_ARUDO